MVSTAMVSTAFDEDTDSGSINLEELEELAASVGVPTAPSFDQGDKPTLRANTSNNCADDNVSSNATSSPKPTRNE